MANIESTGFNAAHNALIAARIRAQKGLANIQMGIDEKQADIAQELNRRDRAKNSLEEIETAILAFTPPAGFNQWGEKIDE